MAIYVVTFSYEKLTLQKHVMESQWQIELSFSKDYSFQLMGINGSAEFP